jgi:hypothetical protein
VTPNDKSQLFTMTGREVIDIITSYREAFISAKNM